MRPWLVASLAVIVVAAAHPLDAAESELALQRVSTNPVNDKFTNELGTITLPGRSITFLVTRRPDDARFTEAYLLFPGSPGYGNLGAEQGVWRYSLKGNFLVRTRRHFLGPGTLAVVIDAPSDQQGSFAYAFRASARYGEDVRAVTQAVERQFGRLDWTFIGTSEGTVTATHAARMLGDVARRLVLTASLVSGASKGERALSEADVAAANVPVLWVHHERDPCWATRYDTVKSIAARLKQPLITVSGADGATGAPCEARSEHGFVGREIATIRAIRAWVRTGEAAALVDRP